MSDPQQGQGKQTAAAVAALTALYMWAETALMGGVARIIRRMVPNMAGQATAARQVRVLGRQVAGELAQHTLQLIDAVIAAASAEGAAHGGGVPPSEPPSASGGGFDFTRSHGERAAEAIRQDLISELADVRFRLTRLDDDIYKTIAPRSAIEQVLGRGLTPQQAQAAAWREFTRQGVTGFTDKSGRDWQLSSYVEMAVRTASMRAFNASNLQTIQALGGNLVTVSDDGTPCPLCLPWQNVVMCIIPDGKHPSIAEAVAAGLHHPNCRHPWVMVTEHTKLPAPRAWTPEMRAVYNATQRQRAIEREIRKAKQQLEYATTAEGRQAARHDVRAAQAQMRQFLAINDTLLRRSHREQLNLALR